MQTAKIGGEAREIQHGIAKIGGEAKTIVRGYAKIGGEGRVIEFSPVPSGYSSVLYLKSDGSQYIDLPFTTQENLVCEFEVGLPSSLSSASRSFYFSTFGYYYNSGYYTEWFHMYAPSGATNFRAISRLGRSDRDATVTIDTLTADTLYEAKVEFGPNATGTTKTTFNGVTATSSSAAGLSSGGRNMRLFTKYPGSSTSSNTVAGLFGKFKAYNATETLCDLWPCYRVSDNKPGYWDTVSETFFTNSGSGDFTLGPAY